MTTPINQTQLDDKMDDHELWLQTGGAQGAKLVLIDYNISNLNLADRDLSLAIFDTSLIVAANFENTILSQASFDGIVDGTNAIFTNCTVDKADFSSSFMPGAVFNYAKVANTNFSNATIYDVKMTEVKGLDINFSDADLTNSVCPRANFTGSNFLRANLTSGYFVDAIFANADLTNVNFTCAIFTGVDFSLVRFDGATGVYSFGPIGDKNRIGFAVDYGANPTMIYLGCFSGTEAEAITEVEAKYGVGSDYSLQIQLAVSIVES